MSDVLPWITSYWIRLSVVAGWVLLWAVFALLVVLWRRRAQGEVCRKCGYPKQGLNADAVCPECGSNKWGRRRLRHRWLARLALACVSLAVGATLPGLCVYQRWQDHKNYSLRHDSLWEYYMSVKPLYSLWPSSVHKEFDLGQSQVRVLVDRRDYFRENEQYQILHVGRKIVHSQPEYYVVDAEGVQLDGSGPRDVAVWTSTMGASCCSEVHIFTIDANAELTAIDSFSPVQDKARRGEPLSFETDHFGVTRLKAVDRTFSYWYSSGAGSYYFPIWLVVENGELVVDWRYTQSQIDIDHVEFVARFKHVSRCTRGKWFPSNCSIYWGTFVELMHLGRAQDAWMFFDECWLGEQAQKAAFEAELMDRVRSWEHYPHMLEVNGGSIERVE